MLTFAGKTIPGTTESIIKGAADRPVRRMVYWDVYGEGEIVGRQGGRNIIITHLIHDQFADPVDLQTYLRDDLYNLQGLHGRLEYTDEVLGDNISEIYDDVTFDHWEPLALQGQEYPCALKDYAGTLFNDDDEADEGWFQYVTLHFRQLIT